MNQELEWGKTTVIEKHATRYVFVAFLDESTGKGHFTWVREGSNSRTFVFPAERAAGHTLDYYGGQMKYDNKTDLRVFRDWVGKMVDLLPKRTEDKSVDEIWCCEECGNQDVSEKKWVDVNSQKVTNDEPIDAGDGYCPKCEEEEGCGHVRLTSLEGFVNKLETWEGFDVDLMHSIDYGLIWKTKPDKDGEVRLYRKSVDPQDHSKTCWLWTNISTDVDTIKNWFDWADDIEECETFHDCMHALYQENPIAVCGEVTGEHHLLSEYEMVMRLTK